MSALRAMVALAVLAAACRERSEPPPPQGSLVVDAGPPPFTVSGRALRHVVAHTADRQLVIRFSDAPGPCGFALDVQYEDVLSIEIPPGPGAKFFAGAPAGVRAFGRVQGTHVEIPASEAIVELEPFTLEKGARVRGKLDTPRGGGAFEAEVCGVESKVAALPDSVTAEPAAGALDGKPFAPKKALIMLRGDAGEPARLDDLRLFTDDSVTCSTLGQAKGPGVYLFFIGGAGSKRPLARLPQPAWASAMNLPIERAHVTGRMPAWLRFDQLAFEPGAKVKGALVIDQTSTRISGRFEAEVCPR